MEQIEQTENELLTVNEVAEVLRCDATTVRRWIEQGTLEALALPHLNERKIYRVRREELDKILNPEHAKKHNHHVTK